MKKWYKYELDLPLIDDHEEFLEENLDEKKILENHFYNSDYGRLVKYFEFIKRNIESPKKILSLGSGDCFLEYMLMKDQSIDMTCSDIKKSKWVDFLPNIYYMNLDITREVPKEKYDVIISMSVLYQFNDVQLFRFFRNVSVSLSAGGILIIDYGGSNLNPISNFIINCYLPIEMKLYSIFIWGKKRGKFISISKNHVGYRISTENLISIAKDCGFVLENSEYIWDIIDLRRSMLFRMISPVGGRVEMIISKLIKNRTPYLRIMKFQLKN